jgi:ABC-2 type transport system ATP-binding protein
VLFLDEPTTGLDPQSRRQLWDVIRDFRSRGRTIVLTTHYMDEAERLCDRVAIIDQGKIIAQGSPAELISRLGGDHIIEFALEETAPGKDLELNALLALESVLAARVENDGFVLTVAPPRAAPGPLDNEARESRRRLRRADRPPPARR